MRYLAININSKLDQQWYYKCASVADCVKYFDGLGPGHGPKVAIYDMDRNQYLWIDETHLGNESYLNGIISEALKNQHRTL